MTFWTLLATFAGLHILLVWLLSLNRARTARRQSGGVDRPTGHLPFASVLVPAWCERGTLERCLDALAAVDYPAWEAIIVAGGPDGTFQAAVERCQNLEGFRVLPQGTGGKNAALNHGLRVAGGEIIVLLDADSRVSPGWLRALAAPIPQRALATTGNPAPLRRTPISLGEQMERIASMEIRGERTLQGSGSIALRRSVLAEIGGFPEDVLTGVDWDLNARLASRGFARAYCPEAKVQTARPATLSEYWVNEVRWRRAHLVSLFRLPEQFLRDPLTAFANLYFYALAWFSALFSGATLLALLISPIETKRISLALWTIFAAWLLLRRAALALETAVYTRNWGWLKLAWVPPVLLVLTLVAILPATLTLNRSQVHFKGPRPQPDAD